MAIKLGQVERPTVGIEDLATPGGRCPACGEPLFPWMEVDTEIDGVKLAHVIDRCENCHLATERGDAGEAIADLIEGIEADVARDGAAEVILPNGASWQASVGAENWAGLHLSEKSSLLNPKALKLLLEHEGLKVDRLSFPAAAGMAQLMQTLLNLITFNRDFARRALRGELKPWTSRHGGLGFGIDGLATVLIAFPVAVLSVLIEGAAVLFRHGGLMRARISRR
jgi:hypothetical protein